MLVFIFTTNTEYSDLYSVLSRGVYSVSIELLYLPSASAEKSSSRQGNCRSINVR